MMTVKGKTGQVSTRPWPSTRFLSEDLPVWPEKVRVTVGTMEEMAKFKLALDRVLAPAAP
jgi:hypothetical protein